MSESYEIGTTIILEAKYFTSQDTPLDADSPPVVTVRDARNRIVQTDVLSTKTASGTYQYKFRTKGLSKGTYFYTFLAAFDGDPQQKSGEFTLKDIAV